MRGARLCLMEEEIGMEVPPWATIFSVEIAALEQNTKCVNVREGQFWCTWGVNAVCSWNTCCVSVEGKENAFGVVDVGWE